MPPPSPAPPPGEMVTPKPPSQWDSPLANAGDWVKGKAQDVVASAFEDAMRAVWDASLTLLKGAFTIADWFSVFEVDNPDGPVATMWPITLWISGVLALGLFFWQITISVLRGGRGFMRVVTGPVQYGIALAVTVGAVAALLVAADGITQGIMHYGLRAQNFTDALQIDPRTGQVGFLDVSQDAIKAVVMGLVAVFGVLPAALGYMFEMLFREAAIYVLVATVPISAAGMLAGTTAKWYWTSVRWMMAAIAMKPVLALTLALGVIITGTANGLSGLLAGVGVLLISVLCPYVLFRLFSFVDPNSDAGQAIRDGFSQAGLPSGPEDLGLDGKGRGDAGGDGGGGAQEDATEDRFDSSLAGSGDDDDDPQWPGQDDEQQPQSGQQQPAGPDHGSDTEAGKPPANSGQIVASQPGGGDDGGGPPDDGDDQSGPPSPPSPPQPPDGSGGPGPSGGGGAQSGRAAEAEEAAVIA